MSTRPVEFLRSAPYVVDPKTRIDQLKENLADEEWHHQKKNILKLIEMYETGELRGLTGGIRTWLKDGEVLDHEPGIEDVTPGTAIWLETLHHQFMQLSRSQELASQMAQSTSNGFLAGTPMHEIFANFRLVPEWGSDPNLSIPVVIANDTGSEIHQIRLSAYPPTALDSPLLLIIGITRSLRNAKLALPLLLIYKPLSELRTCCGARRVTLKLADDTVCLVSG